jgi:hypothetical protein
MLLNFVPQFKNNTTAENPYSIEFVVYILITVFSAQCRQSFCSLTKLLSSLLLTTLRDTQAYAWMHEHVHACMQVHAMKRRNILSHCGKWDNKI